MLSVLFVANGPDAAAAAEEALRDQRLVLTQADSVVGLQALLHDAPFDAIVCGIDSLEADERAVLSCIESAAIPTVVVCSDPALPIRSFDVNRRVVCTNEGPAALRLAIQQQLRRVPPKRDRRASADVGDCEFSFSFPSRPEAIRRARAIAGGFLQRCVVLPSHELLRMELAIEEALSNAVYHGSLEVDPPNEDGELDASTLLIQQRLRDARYADRAVRVSLRVDAEDIRIVVTDEGPGFDASRTAGAPEVDAVLKPAGRGLLLMRAFADVVEFNEVGNRVTLIRKRQLASVPDASPRATSILMSDHR